MPENVAQLEAHRPALTGHCYRMLGSTVDADDAVQETLIRAWRSLDRFDERASLRTWLYRIATNVCLDALAERKRRERPIAEGPAGTFCDTLHQRSREHWIEPVADSRALPSDADPAELAILRQSIRLAFVAALQHLAPKQRAVLLLTEVLGWSATEVAETLDTSVAAVNSALQRARSALPVRTASEPAVLSEPQTKLLNRYVEAFERYEVDTLASLLREDACFSMPPYTLWLQGPVRIREWLNGPGTGCRGSRLLPTAACGSPAFGQYRVDPEGGYKAWALIVLELSDDGIAGWNSFLDTEILFPKFDLPQRLPA
jgi:RNA polymerase sigma-70 factor (ECF subfamily)